MANCGTGIKVCVKNGNLEKALKKFKKKIKESNLMLDIYENQQYTKKSDKRREKLQKSIIRNKYKMEQTKFSER